MDLRLERRVAALGAFLAIALGALSWTAGGALAAETIYWDNYEGHTLAGAAIDGSGGGEIDLGSADLNEPEGLALDVAGGRLFAADAAGGPEEEGTIVFARIDGSGGRAFDTAAAPLDQPEGVAIDPTTQTIYWANHQGGPAGEEGSIGWARLDESESGRLDTSGATVDGPYRLTVDAVHGRVYWMNDEAEPPTISYANADNTGGGGDLDLMGEAPPSDPHGIVVDPTGNRVYWIDYGETLIGSASLSGGDGKYFDVEDSAWVDPYGLAFDPTIGRFYWGNYQNAQDVEGAVGFLDLNEAGGGIDIESAPVGGPQDPVVYKAPVGAGAPQVSGAGAAQATLSCSQGSWASFPGSFVYAEPTSYAYSWSRDGAAIPGAEAKTLAASVPGTYACAVTATNAQGSTTQASAGVSVVAAQAVEPKTPATPASLVLKAPKKLRVKPGWTAVFQATATNAGGTASAPAKLCVKLSKKARKGLKAPRCAALGSIAPGASEKVVLRVKVKKSAKRGAYRLTLALKGAAANAVKAKVVVKGAKKKHRKHRKHRK
jgi:DNA-binding beta-propeller fold protein YncE